jgi:hypothetical protein
MPWRTILEEKQSIALTLNPIMTLILRHLEIVKHWIHLSAGALNICTKML